MSLVKEAKTEEKYFNNKNAKSNMQLKKKRYEYLLARKKALITENSTGKRERFKKKIQ